MLNLDLRPSQAAAFDPAAHDPVDAAMAVIGATVAILPEGSTEFADHDDRRIVPSGPAGLREAGKPVPELVKMRRQVACRCALVDVRIPTPDVHETEIEPAVHQPS